VVCAGHTAHRVGGVADEGAVACGGSERQGRIGTGSGEFKDRGGGRSPGRERKAVDAESVRGVVEGRERREGRD
jgi:hypothetical protein